MTETLRLLFATSRPISWVNTAYPFAAGYLLLGGSLDPMFWIATLFFLIPYNLLMYGVNDVYDYESDIKNPRKDGVEGAITPKKFHRFILSAAYLGCVPFIIGLTILGTWQSTIVLGAVLFFVVAYSLKGLRFKEIPLLDSITSSLHFVGPLLFALSLFDVTASAWIYVATFFAWGIASHAFGAVQDIIPDRQAGIHSVATRIGARPTVIFALVGYLFAAIALATQGGAGLVVGVVLLVYVINLVPFLTISDETSARANSGWRRFLWINYLVGAVITICLLVTM